MAKQKINRKEILKNQFLDGRINFRDRGIHYVDQESTGRIGESVGWIDESVR